MLPRPTLDPEAWYGVHNDLVIVELRSIPDCPNLDRVRTALHTALADLGLPATVVERVCDYPSPSVLIDGFDVMGGGDAAACRLDLPTVDTLWEALRRATDPTDPTEPAPTSPASAGPGRPVIDCCATPGNAAFLGQDQAVQLARNIFEPLLHDAYPAAPPEGRA